MLAHYESESEHSLKSMAYDVLFAAEMFLSRKKYDVHYMERKQKEKNG